MQSWDLTKIEAPEGTRSPAVLETVDGARAIVIRIAPGQELGDHEVRERAWLSPGVSSRPDPPPWPPRERSREPTGGRVYFTADEAEALFLSSIPGPATELGLGPALAAAQLKLRAALPPELRDQADRLASHSACITSSAIISSCGVSGSSSRYR